MKKEEYFGIVKEITTALKAKGFNYVRVFSEARPTMNGYKTKVWDCKNNTKVAKYINKNFGDKVVATAYKTNNVWCITANVEIVPINKVTYPHKEYRNYIMKNGGGGIPHYYDTKGFKVYKKMKKDLGVTTIEVKEMIRVQELGNKINTLVKKING